MPELITPGRQNGALVARIGRLHVGDGQGIKVMGIINTSPESFYKESVRITDSEIGSTAMQMQKDGAQIIDVGGMSTAPYLRTLIPVEKEISRIKKAIKAIRNACELPVSVDTPRAQVAHEAIRSGANAINDVTGLKFDPKMARVVAEERVAVIMGAYSTTVESGTISATVRALGKSLQIARSAGINSRMLVVDPSIGFFRKSGTGQFFTKMLDKPWYERDLEVLSKIEKVARLAPTCVSVSGKSFLGELLSIREPEKRLVPSITCEIYAALHGASIIRTHNVKPAVDALTLSGMLWARRKRL